MTSQEETTAILMATVPDLALKASAMVREMDPEVRSGCYHISLRAALE